MRALPDLPAGTVYVPVLAGSTTPLPRRSRTVQVRRCRSWSRAVHDCPRPWLVVCRDEDGFAAMLPRSFQSFEHARLFVVALLDGQEPTC